MTNTALLEELIQASGYRKSYIAKVLNISVNCLTSKIRGKYEFKGDEIYDLCKLLRIDDLALKEQVFFAPKVD